MATENTEAVKRILTNHGQTWQDRDGTIYAAGHYTQGQGFGIQYEAILNVRHAYAWLGY